MALPNATLLVSPTCPHCRGMKQVLAELESNHRIGKLDIVDITEHPDVAEKLNVRSVPWLQLGELILEGAHTAGELEKWTGIAGQSDALTIYFRDQLAAGNLKLVERMIQQHPERIGSLIALIADPETEMSVRIGVAAIFESHRGTAEVRAQLPDLVRLCSSPEGIVRADACHLLVQTDLPVAIETLERLAQDADFQVREIASEGIDELRQHQQASRNG